MDLAMSLIKDSIDERGGVSLKEYMIPGIVMLRNWI